MIYAESLEKLERWISDNGLAGYDPYDVLGTKPFLFIKRLSLCRLGRYISYPFLLFEQRYRNTIRRLFRISKTVNPKARGLLARSYLNLYKITNDKNWLDKASYSLIWLLGHSSPNYSNLCWGYPWDWQSRIFIPRQTPIGVVTSVCAHAFLDAYEIFKAKKFLNAAKSCCEFILKDLNVDKVAEDKICFSYTPLDDFHVHNANLFSASVLLRIYSVTNCEAYKLIGEKAVNFTVSQQNIDGSWYYRACPDRVERKIDNYHTGFVLSTLYIAWKVLGEEFPYRRELKKGLDYYKTHLFLWDGTPKLFFNRIYPIDIHSCAQGIITFSEMVEIDRKYLDLAKKVARWTIKRMQDEKGFFYYRIYRKGYIDKQPYLRWGEAWMLYALSCLLMRLSSYKKRYNETSAQ